MKPPKPPRDDDDKSTKSAASVASNTHATADREGLIGMHARAKRAENVFAHKLVMPVDAYIPPVFNKSKKSAKFLKDALGDNFIFSSIDANEINSLVNAMKEEKFQAGTTIIKQGDIGDFFYIVEVGTIKYVVDEKTVGECTVGGSFGELALLYNCPRAATCVADSDAVVWKVDQMTFRHLLASKTSQEEERIKTLLRKVEFLKDLDDEKLSNIFDAMTEISFKKGDCVFKKGERGDVFYIIETGTIKIQNIGAGDSKFMDQVYGATDSFGERALLTGEARAGTAMVTEESKCLCLSRETFEKVLGPLQGLIEYSMAKRVLMGIPIFANSKFTAHEMDQLTKKFKYTAFDAGDKIAKQGVPFKHRLYIIRKGRVSITEKNGSVKELHSGDYFGDTFLLSSNDKLSTQTITTLDRTICGILTQEDIELVIGKMERLGKPLASKKKADVKLSEVKKHRILGVGSFGKVWLASCPKLGGTYALKMLTKIEIIGHSQVDGVIREKNIMASVDHPFIVNLVASFQDDKFLYMLIGLVQGGELFTVIHTPTHDGLSDKRAVFYGGCVLESLSHLHKMKICYRDLKPENLLIDKEGYCILTDLGFAKHVSKKTYTLCGTPEYLAPEIILSKGHDKGVDYWAYGVLLYEMLVGYSPFFGQGGDQVAMFKRIVQQKFSFPDKVCQENAKDLIKHLLVRSVTSRYGCLVNADDDIRNHEWFGSLSFDKLIKKKVNAPWIPSIKDALDSSNFESYAYMEKEKQKLKTLTNAQQALFREF